MALRRVFAVVLLALLPGALGYGIGRLIELRSTTCAQPGFVRVCRVTDNVIFCPGARIGADVELL